MYKAEQELATLSPTATAVFSNPIEAETLGLSKKQSEIVLAAYDKAYNGDRTGYCPHYVVSANEANNKLRFDLKAAPITFSMTFPEFIHVVAKPTFEGQLEGLEIFGAGIMCIQEKLLLGEEIDQLDAVVVCYQLNENGERIENTHDVEINVNWHSSMTKTSDYRLIEKLFYDLGEADFSTEDLNQSLELIGNPAE